MDIRVHDHMSGIGFKLIYVVKMSDFLVYDYCFGFWESASQLQKDLLPYNQLLSSGCETPEHILNISPAVVYFSDLIIMYW